MFPHFCLTVYAYSSWYTRLCPAAFAHYGNKYEKLHYDGLSANTADLGLAVGLCGIWQEDCLCHEFKTAIKVHRLLLQRHGAKSHENPYKSKNRHVFSLKFCFCFFPLKMSSYIIHFVDSDFINSLNCKLKLMAEVMRLMNDPKTQDGKTKTVGWNLKRKSWWIHCCCHWIHYY